MPLDASDLREIAIAAVTSSVNSRALDSMEERIHRFGEDLTLLLEGADGRDLFRLTSLLSDMSGFFVLMLADVLERTPEETMRYIAQHMMSSPLTEEDGQEGDL